METHIIAVILAATLHAIIVSVLNRFYQTVAKRLAEWENHRTQTDFENSLVMKVFAFQFVNSVRSEPPIELSVLSHTVSALFLYLKHSADR